MNVIEEEEILKILGLKSAHVVYDSDIVHVDKVVPAGYPLDLGDDSPEYKAALNRLLRHGGRIFFDVRGTSMTGQNIESGDSLELCLDGDVEPMDIVVANVDGEETVKIYYEDENGEKWLVPDSDDARFVPIRLSDFQNVRIIGKITRIVKGRTPRGNMTSALKAVRKAKQNSNTPDRPSNKKIAKAIFDVREKIRVNRHWFCLYNVLKHMSVVDTLGQFAALLDEIMGEEAPKLDLDDLSRLEVGCFSKPVALWEEHNAPVGGSRFYGYLDLAQSFSRALR